MQARRFREDIEDIQRGGDGAQLQRELARGAHECAGAYAEINAEAAHADRERRAREPERALRILMADERKAAPQEVGDEQVIAREQRRGNGCENEYEWNERDGAV